MRTIRKYDVPAIVEAVLEAGKRTGVRVHAQAVLSDHVHLLIGYLPTATISSFVRHAKSESSRRVKGSSTWRMLSVSLQLRPNVPRRWS